MPIYTKLEKTKPVPEQGDVKMKKQLFLVLLLMRGAGTGTGRRRACISTRPDIDPHDQASLQRGARLFVNYCLSCHAAGLKRYNAIGAGSRHQRKAGDAENLMFAGGKIGDYMTIATSPKDANEWFGIVPPDLTVVARARGVDWLYTYLRCFYLDPTRPFGVNNVVFPDVGMPDVLVGTAGLAEAGL